MADCQNQIMSKIKVNTFFFFYFVGRLYVNALKNSEVEYFFRIC